MDQSPKPFQNDASKVNNLFERTHFEIPHQSSQISSHHNAFYDSYYSPLADQNKYESNKGFMHLFDTNNGCSPFNPKSFYNCFNVGQNRHGNGSFLRSNDSPFHNGMLGINGPSPMNDYKSFNKTPLKYDYHPYPYHDRRNEGEFGETPRKSTEVNDNHNHIQSANGSGNYNHQTSYSKSNGHYPNTEKKKKIATVEKLDLTCGSQKSAMSLRIQRDSKEQISSLKKKLFSSKLSLDNTPSNLDENSGKSLKREDGITNFPSASSEVNQNSSSSLRINSNNQAQAATLGALSKSNENNNENGFYGTNNVFSTIILKSSNSILLDFGHSNGQNHLKGAFDLKLEKGMSRGKGDEDSIQKDNSAKTILETPTPQVSTKTFCKCKKSNCLKLYCACIANEEFCSPDCNCSSCLNTVENELKRNEVVNQIRQKNPRAFSRKTYDNSHESKRIVIEINKNQMEISCKCSNSGCVKKYCECYKNGIGCTERCNCKVCGNYKSVKYETVNHRESENSSKLGSGKVDLKAGEDEINFKNIIPKMKIAAKSASVGVGYNESTQRLKQAEQHQLIQQNRKPNIPGKKLVFDNVSYTSSNHGLGNLLVMKDFDQNEERSNNGNDFYNYSSFLDSNKLDNSKLENSNGVSQHLRLITNDLNKKFLKDKTPVKGESPDCYSDLMNNKSDDEINTSSNKSDLHKKRKRSNIYSSADVGQIGGINGKHTLNFKTPISTPDINQRHSGKTDTTGCTYTSKQMKIPKDFSNVKKNLDTNFKNI